MMSLCQTCKYAVCDYVDDGGGRQYYFVGSCKKYLDIKPEGDECEEYEENTEVID